MSKFMISDTTVYRVGTVAEVEQLHEDLKDDPSFTLASFSYKTKYIKAKGEILEEYQLVTAKKLFTDEKEPGEQIQTNKVYWTKKLKRNVERDKYVNDVLLEMGWIVLRYWESDILKNLNEIVAEILDYMPNYTKRQEE